MGALDGLVGGLRGVCLLAARNEAQDAVHPAGRLRLLLLCIQAVNQVVLQGKPSCLARLSPTSDCGRTAEVQQARTRLQHVAEAIRMPALRSMLFLQPLKGTYARKALNLSTCEVVFRQRAWHVLQDRLGTFILISFSTMRAYSASMKSIGRSPPSLMPRLLRRKSCRHTRRQQIGSLWKHECCATAKWMPLLLPLELQDAGARPQSLQQGLHWPIGWPEMGLMGSLCMCMQSYVQARGIEVRDRQRWREEREGSQTDEPPWTS